MRLVDSVMPEKSLGELTIVEQQIFSFVCEHWPSYALDIAKHFSEPVSSIEEKRRASSKYSYYLKKLVSRQLLFSRRMGNLLVVWPMQAEKLRVVHQILKEK